MSAQPKTASARQPELVLLEASPARLSPFVSDPIAMTFAWQRYQFLRELFDGARVADAGCGEGYGLRYAAFLAAQAVGVDADAAVRTHAERRYPELDIRTQDAASFDFSPFEVALCLDTLQQQSDPEPILAALGKCTGTVVISVPNPAVCLPGCENQVDVQKFDAETFQALIEQKFGGRPVHWFSQPLRWPGRLREGLIPTAAHWTAIIGPESAPSWPSVGIVIPTHNGATKASEAVLSLTANYPGELKVTVVANGCDDENIAGLQTLCDSAPELIELVELPENRGYALGCNAGLARLMEGNTPDLVGVSNDDVLPGIDCVPELVNALLELRAAGHNPGAVGPVSNAVSSGQEVDLGPMSNPTEMQFRAESWRADHANSVTQTFQLRGLFLLWDPQCLRAVGGFDPRFGLGNYEDDDHNLRAIFSGYSLWIAQGAFLYHEGSATFRRLGIDYQDSLAQNLAAFAAKWGVDSLQAAFELASPPEGVPVTLPFTFEASSGYSVRINGRDVDLVHGASDVEFAAWVMHALSSKPKEARYSVIRSLTG